MPSGFRYVVVMPAKNEANTIGDSISSVIAQTLHPTEMIVVDDCSSDDTANIVKSYLSEASWLRILRRNVSGPRMIGSRVVETFNYGLERLKTKDYDFIVKLDADIILEPTYFSRLLSKFEAWHNLGIAGGVTYIPTRKGLKREIKRVSIVLGPVKTYKRKCFEDIGGLVSALGWDTIDCVKAEMMGWKVQTFEDMPVIHRRIMGMKMGLLKARVKWGRNQYFLGYYPLYVLASAILKFFDSPLALGSIAILWGYFTCFAQGRARFNDPEFIRFVRSEQIRKLTFHHDSHKKQGHKL